MSVLQSEIPPFTVEPRRQIYLGMDPNDQFRRCWASPEESVGVIGPPRFGKTTGVVIPSVLTWDGPVLAVSSRSDLMRFTRHWRGRLAARGGGQVYVYDPFVRMPAEEARVHWSPLDGCEDPAVCWRRAIEMARIVAKQGGLDAEILRSGATAILRATMHAAAISGGNLDDVARWLAMWDFEPVMAILRNSDTPVAVWADGLEHLLVPNDWERRLVGAAQICIDALAHPRVRVSMHTSDLDIDKFLQTGSTLFVVVPDKTDLVAPFTFSLLDAITQRAAALAARSPSGRLDPPLLLALDDMVNVIPHPGLDSIMSELGSIGVVTLWTAQSMGSISGRFGGNGRENLLATTTVKLIYGGASHDEDLSDVSTWAGRLNRQELLLPPEAVQMLPPFYAWMFYPGSEPLLVETRPAGLLEPYRQLAAPPATPGAAAP